MDTARPPNPEIILQNKLIEAEAKATKWRNRMLKKAKLYREHLAEKARREAEKGSSVNKKEGANVADAKVSKDNKDGDPEVAAGEPRDVATPPIERKRTRSVTLSIIKEQLPRGKEKGVESSETNKSEGGTSTKRRRYTREEKGKGVEDTGKDGKKKSSIVKKKRRVVPNNPDDVKCKRRGRRDDKPREVDNIGE
ncbi:uncharacterized protein LOC130990630 [Salvia miltiorrhiza]|uniref:uncharacterized protein LOC130990630 n=1 Tax=Salvia miltiorrhiza TaxID=226208 RepID=UPI0025ACD268|nr:uncharacterized protein LOC130990630 [Salvia miltiorrhiza]